ncbi:tryptophan biosynthesis modulator TrpM [Streptomyces sp. GC420]|uniref:tryptophan biosynthesis modulator TrpM n=1 Tax=Streptomyces sp. GC420 TaxID=2697568 RepID=UPI001D241206|nr:tryptophan synthase subunit(beta) [Streptomyces sp. GC420]
MLPAHRPVPTGPALRPAGEGACGEGGRGSSRGPAPRLLAAAVQRPARGPFLVTLPCDRHAPLARGCRPRGCRAPARRVHGRRVRYVIGSEPGQVNGMRWRGRARSRAA